MQNESWKLRNCCAPSSIQFLVFKAFARIRPEKFPILLSNFIFLLKYSPKICDDDDDDENQFYKNQRQEEKLLRIFGSLVTHSMRRFSHSLCPFNLWVFHLPQNSLLFTLNRHVFILLLSQSSNSHLVVWSRKCSPNIKIHLLNENFPLQSRDGSHFLLLLFNHLKQCNAIMEFNFNPELSSRIFLYSIFLKWRFHQISTRFWMISIPWSTTTT